MAPSATSEDRQRLVERHLPLVKRIALGLRDHLPADLELDDLISWGMQGMLEAAERFDATRGAAFTTFAYYRARGSMIDGIRASSRLTRAEYGKVKALERADDYLENAAAKESGADPQALARRSTTDVLGQIADHVGAITTIYVLSLEDKAGAELADPGARAQFDRLDSRGLGPHLKTALATLDDQERQLVELCYFGDTNIKDAGERLGVSKSRACRIHGRAIHKLRTYFAARDAAVPPPDAPPPR